MPQHGRPQWSYSRYHPHDCRGYSLGGIHECSKDDFLGKSRIRIAHAHHIQHSLPQHLPGSPRLHAIPPSLYIPTASHTVIRNVSQGVSSHVSSARSNFRSKEEYHGKTAHPRPVALSELHGHRTRLSGKS